MGNKLQPAGAAPRDPGSSPGLRRSDRRLEPVPGRIAPGGKHHGFRKAQRLHRRRRRRAFVISRRRHRPLRRHQHSRRRCAWRRACRWRALPTSRWAVSARGFNGRFANKLLVLMDGRSSLLADFRPALFWEVQDAHARGHRPRSK
ncbi:MAG: hypothetical protein MZW92_29245 [Comamonadaceae bacterium]|nr:hypothetical protein [Comamonadaceae bacterium]